jgi:hypothetical protein
MAFPIFSGRQVMKLSEITFITPQAECNEEGSRGKVIGVFILPINSPSAQILVSLIANHSRHCVYLCEYINPIVTLSSPPSSPKGVPKRQTFSYYVSGITARLFDMSLRSGSLVISENDKEKGWTLFQCRNRHRMNYYRFSGREVQRRRHSYSDHL